MSCFKRKRKKNETEKLVSKRKKNLNIKKNYKNPNNFYFVFAVIETLH